VSPNELRVVFKAREAGDLAAANTAEELRHIHGSEKENGRTLRNELFARWTQLLYWITRLPKGGPARDEAVEVLKLFIRKDQPFSGVVRGSMRHSYPEEYKLIEG